MPPEQAAQLTSLHVEHHVRLGFAGYSVFLTTDYFPAFAANARLARQIASGQVGSPCSTAEMLPQEAGVG